MLKNSLFPDHIPVNKFELIVVGAPGPMKFIKITGLERELETVSLPDRTTASGGNVKPVEFTATHPKHHVVEDTFLEAWLKESELAVPSYKKAGSLLIQSISGLVTRSYTLLGLYPCKSATPDLDAENEGELFVTTWTFKADNIIPT